MRAAAAVLLLALAAGGAAAFAHQKRMVEYAIVLDAVQTTTWTAHGSYAWCGISSQRLPYDGKGQAILRFALPADARAGLPPGGPASFAATVPGTVQRSGSLVEHDAAVTARPAACPQLGTADEAVDTSGCG